MEPIIAGMILLIALPKSVCSIYLYGESELCGQVQKVIKPNYWIFLVLFLDMGLIFFPFLILLKQAHTEVFNVHK